jgi:hypothetical protein
MDRSTKLATLVALGAFAAATTGCQKSNELPSNWSGRYRRTAAFGLAADQFVTVAPRALTVGNCQFNCGTPVVALTSVRCEPGGACSFTSEHCTGTIEVDTGHRLSVTAQPTPTTATGDALALHNETCNNIRGNLMDLAQ